MKTGGEGVNELLEWYANKVKWLKDLWTPVPGYFDKKGSRRFQKKE